MPLVEGTLVPEIVEKPDNLESIGALKMTAKPGFATWLIVTILGLLPSLASAVDFEIKDITWKLGPPLPGACKGQAQAVIGNSVIGVGGAEIGKRESDTAWRLDTRTMRYELLPKPPVIVSYSQGVTVGEDFYLFTGNMQDSHRSPPAKRVSRSNRMFRMSRVAGKWTWQELPGLRQGRAFAGAAVSGTTIVVIGGEISDSQRDSKSVEAFDTAKPMQGWFDIPEFPGAAREAMAAAGIGDNVYVIGGLYTDNNGAPGQHKDAYVLNLKTRHWRRLPDCPIAVDNWEGAVFKNRFLIMAGGLKRAPDGKRVPMLEVVVFDTASESYHIMPTKLPAFQIHPYDYAAWVSDAMLKLVKDANMDPKVGTYRAGAEVSVVDNRVFVCGGEVISPEFNVTTEVLVGTIHERPAAHR